MLIDTATLAARPKAAGLTHGHSPQTQPPLPFARNALEPTLSARTIDFHYGKHHKGYFDTLAELVAGTPHAEASLEEIILATVGDPEKAKIFNNAAQCWNHNFYWNSLTAEAQTPTGPLAAAITRDFGSLDAARTALAEAATTHFGSGYGWLVSENGTLKAIATHDAQVPFTQGQVPLLTIDVWEHAYYLDVQNRRPDYVEAIVTNHLNWRFAEDRFESAAA